MEIRKMDKNVDEQQQAKIAMETQELKTMQINLMKRKKGDVLLCFPCPSVPSAVERATHDHFLWH